MLMEADRRQEQRDILQYINEEVIGGGYQTLAFNVYSMDKIQDDPDALPEEDWCYLGAAADFEESMQAHKAFFNLSVQQDVLHIYFDTDKSKCIMEVLL